MTPDKALLSGLGKRLLTHGDIEEATLLQAQEKAQEEKKHLIAFLAENKIIDSNLIAQATCEEFGIPMISLNAIAPEQIPKNIVKESLIRQHTALPLLKKESRLYIAIADPANLQALDDIKFNTGLNTDPIVVSHNELVQAIEQYLDSSETSALNIDDDGLFDLEDDAHVDQNTAGESGDEVIEDAPIVKFVNKILFDAIKTGVSDIHFEPYEKIYRVRFRTDGILKEVTRPPTNSASKIAARLKVMSSMDISERRIPQDGRIKLKVSKTRAIDFRVNTLPTLWGEKICLRILDPDSAKLGIDMLGYEEDQKALFMDALNQPQGMILVTGPTGSGKTVSLYTGLNILNTEERNISTAEDPVEINLEGINQVNVNTKTGLDFSSALRAFLRQDPDIVMVGEIRDLETAQISIKAAQTGHLVLSTLHTNSAPETLTRLRNMGVPSFNIATSVSLIIAQRLARRLCNHCKEPLDIPRQSLLELGFNEHDIQDATIYGPVGCEHCNEGYKGRVGIYEVVKITDEIARVIMQDGNAIEIADVCRKEGFNDLRASGLLKIRSGVTSVAEVDRVTTGH